MPKTSGPDRWRKWRRALEVLFALCALTPIALFLVAAMGRMGVSAPLEQLEGSMLLAAERVAHGLPIYAQPNFNFIPYMYAPAYYYVSGWAVHWLGPGFFPLRLVSLLSTCASMAILYVFVLFEVTGSRTRRHLVALAAAGLYAAAYPWTREWFDLGRVDSLYVLLLLLALLCTRHCQRGWHPLIAAAAWTLTFLAKQTIFPVALIMLCYDWKHPKRLVTGVVGFLAMAGVSTWWINHATHGWYWFYAFTVPRANADLLLRPAVFFIPSQVLAPFGIAVLIVAIAWAQAKFSIRSETARFYFLAAASLTGLCWFLQAHQGATFNTPMPVYAVLAILFGVAIGRLDETLARDGLTTALREPARTALLIAAMIPLVSWIYNPGDFLPHSNSTAAHRELISWLRTIPGDVYLPAHPLDGVLAGKSEHPDVAATHDALSASDPATAQPLLAEIHRDIAQEKFDAIVLDGPPKEILGTYTWLPQDLQSHYPIVGLVPGGEVGNRFTPHPVYFLLPCRERELAIQRGWILVASGGQSPCPR